MFRNIASIGFLLAGSMGVSATDIVINNVRVIDAETGLDAIRNVAIEADPAALSLPDISVTNPAMAIASDPVLWSYFDDNGNALNYDGDAWPLPDNVFSHPRSTATYTKILRSYVRERGLLSLNEASRKMSQLPAQTQEESVPQMRTKGRLQVGMDADIVVFDPATVADLATFENANQLTVGVQTVVVNGGFSVRDGELVLDAPNGRAIRNAVVN